MNKENKRTFIILIIFGIASIIITSIIIITQTLKPKQLANFDQCILNELPNQYYLEEKYVSVGNKLDIILLNGTKWGTFSNTIHIGLNPIYQIYTIEYPKVTQINAKMKLFSFTTYFTFVTCEINDNNIDYDEYTMEETIEQKFLNLNGIYTQYTIYKNGYKIAISEKKSLIDTNIKIIDMDNNIISTMNRNYIDSLLIDKWTIDNKSKIPNWLSGFIASLVTIRSNENNS